MLEFEYYQPRTTDELTAVLDRTGGRVVAGGTDVLPRLRRGLLNEVCLIDISRLADLRYIRQVDGHIEIGALTTYAELLHSPLIQREAPALAQAAATVGCPQTRHRGTIGGNLANASPAADSVPSLLTLDANVHLARSKSERAIRLCDFFVGPGKTRLESGEYIHHVTIAHPTGKWGASFHKLGKRSGMAISVASAAAYLELGLDGRLQAARLAFGSVAPCPVRASHAEEMLRAKAPTLQLFQQAAQAALADISPIGDIRASLEYRVHVVPILAQRALRAALQQAETRAA
jgi:carbon-monoxide dehydrogenase medium subunit